MGNNSKKFCCKVNCTPNSGHKKVPAVWASGARKWMLFRVNLKLKKVQVFQNAVEK